MSHLLQNNHDEPFFVRTVEALRSGYAHWGVAAYLFMDLSPEETTARSNALKDLRVTEEEMAKWQWRREQDADSHFRIMSMQ